MKTTNLLSALPFLARVLSQRVVSGDIQPFQLVVSPATGLPASIASSNATLTTNASGSVGLFPGANTTFTGLVQMAGTAGQIFAYKVTNAQLYLAPSTNGGNAYVLRQGNNSVISGTPGAKFFDWSLDAVGTEGAETLGEAGVDGRWSACDSGAGAGWEVFFNPVGSEPVTGMEACDSMFNITVKYVVPF